MNFIENAKPIYLQISDRICDEVMDGLFPPDSRIPSVREYAATVQVNANTVMRSYMHLSDKGIIYNKRGIGFFTAPNARELIEQLRQQTFFDEEAQYFFTRLGNMGITPATLSQLYSDFLKSKAKID